MNLKNLLGDSYKDGMTFADIETALAGKKLADLSTGNYVDKNKYESEVGKLKANLADANGKLNDKLTDDEKRQQQDEETQKLIESLKEQVKNQGIENNKNKSIATLAESKALLEIKDDDKDYVGFIDCLSKSEANDADAIAKYVGTLIKNAYEKGKNDTTKNNLGQMGKQKGNASGNGKKDEVGAFGKQLAESIKGNSPSFSYFGKYNK